MKPLASSVVAGVLVALAALTLLAQEARVLEPRLRYLRMEGPREWSEFPESPEADRLEASFTSSPNDREWTLQVRQQDVKQGWSLHLNNQKLGALPVDENDMVVYLAVPPGAVREGENRLRIEQTGRKVRRRTAWGKIVLHPRPRAEVLNEATVEIEVRSTPTPQPTAPFARITVVNAARRPANDGAESNEQIAVRPGVVYTSSSARRGFGVPAGKYTIYAGRGFEYSLASGGNRIARPARREHRSLADSPRS
jgi:hypothetical protein